MTLLYDIYSTVKKSVLYAPKGAKVRLVKDMGDVLIVEYNNNKFSIKRDETNIHNCQ